MLAVVVSTLLVSLVAFGVPSGANSAPEMHISNVAPTAASMSSPTPGSKLTSSSVTFEWTAGTGITAYYLYIGTTPGGNNIASVNAHTSLSAMVSTLPTNGGTFYVTLLSYTGTTWLRVPYTYIATGSGTGGTMTSPTVGSKLTSGTATFTWSAGTGISSYFLYIGTTSGGNNLGTANPGSKTTATVTTLPTNGETFYVTLLSLNGATWIRTPYTYIASGTGTGGVMTIPTPGSKFGGSSVTFDWTAGTGISSYFLYVGTTAGGNNIASVNPGSKLTATVTTMPTNGETVYVTLLSLNGATWIRTPYTYTAEGTPLSFQSVQDQIPNGLINTGYSGYLQINSGVGPFTFSLASGSLPPGVVLSTTNPGELIGTPTSAGTYTFTAKVKDSTGATATSSSLPIVISAVPTGANNATVTGRYVCSIGGYLDSDNSHYSSVYSIAVDGAGHVTSGVFDENGRTTGLSNGTVTGTYSLGSNNNGTLTMTTTVGATVTTTHYGVMAGGFFSGVPYLLEVVEIDDAGNTPVGHHSGGPCLKSTPSDFSSTKLAGSNFVFVFHGENQSGNPRATAGVFGFTSCTASACTIANGVGDEYKGTTDVLDFTFSGTSTIPDSTTGRFTTTFTTSSGSTSSAAYIVDANQMVMTNIDTSNGAQKAEVYKQQQSSYSLENLNNSFVLHELTSTVNGSNVVQSYGSQLSQGTSDGLGEFIIDQSYTDSGGTYSVGEGTGQTNVTVASNGRTAFTTTSGAGFLYLYNNNAALEVAGGAVTGGNYDVEFGYMEPQTLTTFTDAALAGNYVGADYPRIEPQGGESTLLLDATSSGTASDIENDGGQGEMAYAGTGSATFAWTSTTYGTFSVSQGGSADVSCIAIAAGRFACMENTSGNPNIILFQQ
jgi:hypothetical protein